MINTHSILGGALSGLSGLLKPQQSGGFARTNQLAPQVTDHAGRDSGLSGFDTGKAATLLNDKLAAALGGALGTNAPQAAQGGDFSPEKVAGKILSFIDSAIGAARANGADPAAIEKKQADAKAAIEKGFGEARDILQSFGAWSGAVKDNAEKTLDLINKGLTERAAGQAPQAAPTQGAGAVQSASLATYDAKRAETFEMEIKTREGDVVKLSYATNQASGFSASRVADGNGVTEELSAYSSQSKSLSFSVQGDLNDDEKQAIANLMKGVDKLAQDFYGGDMQGAMQHAMALDMNQEQLSNVSLDLSYTQSRRAVSAYQQVGALDGNSPQPLGKGDIGTIGDFNKNLDGMFREADKFFQNADNIVKKLLRDLSPDASATLTEGADKGKLSNILEGLINATANRNTQAVSSQAA